MPGLLATETVSLLAVTAPQATAAVMWVAAVAVPAILIYHGRRQPAPVSRVFMLVSVIAGSLGLAHAVSTLPIANSSLGVTLTAAAAVIALFGVGALLRRLPADSERAIRGNELERLHLLEAAVNASGDGVMIAEATSESEPAPRIAFANPAFSCMMGYTSEETLGSSPSIYTDPELEAEQEALGLIRQALRGSDPLQLEMPSRRKDGTRMWAEWQIVPVQGSGLRPSHYVAILRDTTERRRLEAQLRESQKMDAIGRLAGGIAHDFNNLLTVVHGNAELLRDENLEPVVAAELIADIRGASERAAGLVRQLLTFGRRQPARLEVVDLNLIVKEMAGLLRRVLGENVVINTSFAAHPVKTRVDRSQLEQVVMNLAVNARDAMPRGGTLTISTSALTESHPGQAPNRIARLLVSDTGTGMSPEVRANIFVPFFTTKAPGKGTGLGLATVYGIVKSNAGKIGVDSAPGVGTAFRIEFPWCDAPAGSSSSMYLPVTPQTRDRQVGFGRSILLVEDETAVRKMARAALEGYGYSVTEAECAEGALELLEAGRAIDLLVTDLTMPGMGGRELAAQVRSRIPDLGVVFISGYAPDANWLDEVPGAVFLPKPFTPADLLRAAGKAIARVAKRAAQPA